MPPSRFSWIAAASLAGVASLFRLADFQAQLFGAASPALTVYQGGRLALAVLLLLSILSLGAGLRRRFAPTSEPLAALCLSFLLGFVALNFSLALLAFSRGLFFGVVLAIFAFPLLCFAPLAAKEVREAWAAIFPADLTIWRAPLILLFLFSAAFFYLIKVVPPDGVAGDVFASYFPYFQSIVQSASSFPPEGSGNFFSKGNGLTFGFVVLGDFYQPQFLAFFSVLAMGLMAVQAIRSLLPGRVGRIGALLAGGAFPLSAVAETPTTKYHLTSGFLLAASAFYVLRLLIAPEEERRSAKAGLLAASFGAAAATPATLPYLALCLLPALAFAQGSGGRRQIMFLAGFGAFFIGALTLALNYFIFGLFEINPTGLAVRWMDEARVSRHVDPLAFRLYSDTMASNGDAIAGAGAVVRDFSVLDFFVENFHRLFHDFDFILFAYFLLLVTGAVGYAIYVRRQRAPLRTASLAWRPWLFLFCVLVLLAILGFVVRQGSRHRFEQPLLIWIDLVLLFSIIAACLRAAPARLQLTFLCVLTAAMVQPRLAHPARWNGVDVGLRDSLRYLSGRDSLAGLLANRGRASRALPECLEIVRSLPQGAKVMRLNYGADVCAGIPGGSFPHEYLNSFNRGNELTRVLYGTPAEQVTIFRTHGINYFLLFLDLDPNTHVFSPLFAPDSLARHFQVERRWDSALLLTWKASGASLSREDIARYREFHGKHQTQMAATAYRRLAETVK